MKIIKIIAAVAITGALAIGAGCSTGPETKPSAPDTAILAPEDDTKVDFDTAVEFAKATYADDNDTAATLVVPGSAAAKYVTHQIAVEKAALAAGTDTGSETGADVTSDDDAGTVTIEVPSDDEGTDPTVYVWKDWKFKGGKIVSWTGKSGPIAKVLWTRGSKASNKLVSAKLVSAYKAQGGAVFVVVELKAKHGMSVGETAYVNKAGFSQTATSDYVKLSGGETTYASFVAEKADFGGKLKMEIDDKEGYPVDTIKLQVR